MRILFTSIAAAVAFAAALPAVAQSWQARPQVRMQIEADIRQLKMQIDRAAARRTISFREASGLRRDALNLRRDYDRFSRDGLDRREIASLQLAINKAHQVLRLERRDWDDHRG